MGIFGIPAQLEEILSELKAIRMHLASGGSASEKGELERHSNWLKAWRAANAHVLSPDEYLMSEESMTLTEPLWGLHVPERPENKGLTEREIREEMLKRAKREIREEMLKRAKNQDK